MEKKHVIVFLMSAAFPCPLCLFMKHCSCSRFSGFALLLWYYHWTSQYATQRKHTGTQYAGSEDPTSWWALTCQKEMWSWQIYSFPIIWVFCSHIDSQMQGCHRYESSGFPTKIQIKNKPTQNQNVTKVNIRFTTGLCRANNLEYVQHIKHYYVKWDVLCVLSSFLHNLRIGWEVWCITYFR